jgi:exonuclease VII small subunit
MSKTPKQRREDREAVQSAEKQRQRWEASLRKFKPGSPPEKHARTMLEAAQAELETAKRECARRSR